MQFTDLHSRCLIRTLKREVKKRQPFRLFSVISNPYGLSYAEWTAKWWQWALSIPRDQNPLLDPTGKNCLEGQEGPVFFLAGTTLKVKHAQRRCNIPSGKAILFPILASQFSYSEARSITREEDLISLTSRDISRWTLLKADIDGYDLKNIEKYRVTHGLFDLNLPADNIWNLKEGITKAASDGFWAFLYPLKEGPHRIAFHGAEPNFETDVLYHITIKPNRYL